MQYFVYILTNYTNSVLYTGVTNNLIRRIEEHKANVVKGFSNKYKTHKLIYTETFEDIQVAIEREKQLKNWHRDWKLNLIREQNPTFKDLSQQL